MCMCMRMCMRARMCTTSSSIIITSCSSSSFRNCSDIPDSCDRPLPKTRNKMRVAIESGKGMKVKVVKLCWNKWNGPFFMHIYDKQCGIMQKNQWKGSNIQTQYFYNGTSGALCWKRQKTPKLEKLKRKLLNFFSSVPTFEVEGRAKKCSSITKPSWYCFRYYLKQPSQLNCFFPTKFQSTIAATHGS